MKIKVIITDNPLPPRDSFTTNEIGRMDIQDENYYYGKIFERGDGIYSKNQLLTKLTNLETIEEATDPKGYDNTYGSINMSRYVNLHINKSLNSSNLNEQLLKDYTKEEIINNEIYADRIYIESKINLTLDDFNHNESETDAVYKRITLENLKLLGVGTLNPMISIPIYINKQKINNFNNYFLVDAYQTGEHVEVNGGVKIKKFLETFSHELAHAESAIKDPTIFFIWQKIEDYFKGKISNYHEVAVLKDNITDFNSEVESLKGLIINPDYPRPIDNLYSENSVAQDRLNDLNQDTVRFLAKTGNGHLRGNLNALFTASQERVTGENLRNANKKTIRDLYPDKKIVLYTDTDYNYKYCFLNYDDANLNP